LEVRARSAFRLTSDGPGVRIPALLAHAVLEPPHLVTIEMPPLELFLDVTKMPAQLIRPLRRRDDRPCDRGAL